MNPFANPGDAVLYEYEEFPKPEASLSFLDFNQNLSQDSTREEITSSGHFVDFLNLGDQPKESIPTVQMAIFQNFKDVLIPSKS